MTVFHWRLMIRWRYSMRFLALVRYRPNFRLYHQRPSSVSNPLIQPNMNLHSSIHLNFNVQYFSLALLPSKDGDLLGGALSNSSSTSAAAATATTGPPAPTSFLPSQLLDFSNLESSSGMQFITRFFRRSVQAKSIIIGLISTLYQCRFAEL